MRSDTGVNIFNINTNIIILINFVENKDLDCCHSRYRYDSENKSDVENIKFWTLVIGSSGKEPSIERE